ncbi:MAG: hypothetical protein KF842_05030 [Caulobacter sp.]|nr:hypothetical protein [Caulobacter sp.]
MTTGRPQGLACKAPRLRKDINETIFLGLPPWSAGPGPDFAEIIDALRAAGVEAVQSWAPERFLKAGFRATGLARIMSLGEADAVARRGADLGLEFTTVHLGDGFETHPEGERLVEDMLEASARRGHPLHLETHRGTLTQDMRRTIDLAARFPDLCFTADLSHWYTGLEMTFGDFNGKLDRLAPVFQRVRSVHGRIGDSGCIQVGMSVDPDREAIGHFREMWRRCFQGFLSEAGPGEVLSFAAELLPHHATFGGRMVTINYARQVRGEDGALREESDRWTDAEALWRIAQEAFADAGG